MNGKTADALLDGLKIAILAPQTQASAVAP